MTRDELRALQQKVFRECTNLFECGQTEYARKEDDALANFDRVAERRKLKPAEVVLVYLEKHLDGIHAWADGHTSQRESVAGRINDAINYLVFLRAMSGGSAETHQPEIVEAAHAVTAVTTAKTCAGCSREIEAFGHEVIVDDKKYHRWCAARAGV